MRLGIQLYTLRTLNESLPATIERIADTPFEGVQFARLGDATPQELSEVLAETGLAVAGAHVGLDALEDEYTEIRDAYASLNCMDLVVPSYEREAFETEAGARQAGQRLTDVRESVAADGFDLHYHNHTFEFTALGDGTAFDAFANAAEGVQLEIDTGLASHAGVDPVALIDQYGDRVSLVHLTDSRQGADNALHVDLGEGEVDLAGCVDAARKNSVEWLIFEHGLTDDPILSMEHAAETLMALLEA